MTKYLMCIYLRHTCIFIYEVSIFNLWLGGLCTDSDNTTNTDDDNYAQQINHDYIGSFGLIPNEPKSQKHRYKFRM